MVFQTEKQYFQEVLEKSKKMPVLVDFYAPWCVPCREFAPRLECLSDTYSGKTAAYTVNTDTETELAERYAVTQLPTVILFEDGKITGRWEQAIPVPEIEDRIK